MRFHHLLLLVCVGWLAVLSTTSATFSGYSRFKRPYYFAAAPVVSGWPAPVGQYHQVPLHRAVASPAVAPAFGGIYYWKNGVRFRRQQRPITQRPVNRWRYVHTLYDYEHPDHHHIYHS